MKIKIIFPKKASDGNITLYDIPFDTNKFDDIVRAFRESFGADVDKIVKLQSRSNQKMTFDFTGPEETLKKFFEKFYVQRTWEEIKGKRNGSKEKSKKNSDVLVKDFIELLLKLNLKFSKVLFDSEKKMLSILDLEGKPDLFKILTSKTVTALFKKNKYIYKGHNIANPKNIEIKLEELTSSD